MDQIERLFLLELWRQAAQTLAVRAKVRLVDTDWPIAWQWTIESPEAVQAKQLTLLTWQLLNNSPFENTTENSPSESARLPNMLSTIVRTNNGNDAARQRCKQKRFHPLRALDLTPNFLFPTATGLNEEDIDSESGYVNLWQGLWSALIATDFSNLKSVLAILKRFTWAVPASLSGLGMEVSFYEQVRMAAAVGICWHRAGWSVDGQLNAPLDQRLGWLVKGDLSGVQDFLYLLTSAGAARGLRGRSFYLQLLTETIAEWTLRRWNQVPPTNLIYTGGGHFYLLLPNVGADDDTQWRQLQRELGGKLWNAHRGDLGCTLARVELKACDLVTVGRLAERWAELAEASNAQKERKWSELGETMFEHLFTPQQRGTTNEDMCQICQHDFDKRRSGDREEEGVRKCGRCRSFEQLGRKLRDVRHLVRFNIKETPATNDVDWQAILGSFGQRIELIHDGESMPDTPVESEAILIESVNRWWRPNEQEQFESTGIPAQYSWRWLADAMPFKYDDQGEIAYDRDNQPEIAEFSDLAEARAQGAPWLGVLRMDVDNLGNVLRDGLQGAASLARLSTLSETLRLYFEGWVPQLCEKYNQGKTEDANGDAVYLIYAGGDDLFVVGAWSVLPHLARNIHDDFAEFVGGEHITISAGVAIEHAKYPLYQFAEDARVALDDHAKGLRPAKDAFCFLQTPLGWEQFKDVEDWQKRLVKMLADGMPRSLLTRLSEIHASYAENSQKQRALAVASGISHEQIKEQIQYARWQWRLVYQLSQTSERNPKHQAELTDLQEALVRDDKLINLLQVLARWTELQTRNPKSNG